MRSDPGRAGGAVAAVTAVYLAFLLCAQFGFLAQLERELGADPRALGSALAAMAASGIAAGFAAARSVARGAGRGAVRAGLLAVAAACLLSSAAQRPLALALAAAALGATLGWTTVALAGSLGRLAPRGSVGRAAGYGTGLAYLLANLPRFFSGPPELRAAVPALVCALAALGVPEERAGSTSEQRPSKTPFPALVAIFLVLVALDSAAFASIQHTPHLLEASWGGGAGSARQGVAHLLAAITAGLALDRGRLRELLLATSIAFACALPAIGLGGLFGGIGALLYAAGISAYSAALVAAPTLATGRAGGSPAARAAWLYGVAGWLGSGLGVGASADLAWSTIASGALLALGLIAALLLFRAARRWSPTLVAVAVGASGAFAGLALPVPGPADAIAQGRQVYLAEGCQHCHSQFVRPATPDELWWGPRRALDRRERPPTPGNRRVGPDLANVGLRRSALWQEAHLRDPRALSPGSRMPSYAHLFEDGSGRGAALVAYLGSLGAGAERERLAAIRGAPAPAPERAPARDRGARLFARHCAPCHGGDGRGGKPALGRAMPPGLDLGDGPLRRVRDFGVEEPLEQATARVIRFGLPPWTMPGHEWLDDQEVADLASFVVALAASRGHGVSSGGQVASLAGAP